MEFTLVFLVCLVTTTAAVTKTDFYAGDLHNARIWSENDMVESNTAPKLQLTNCGNDSYYGPSGVISSPNYPDNYDSGLNCSYYIYASEESSLELWLTSFITQGCCDIVTISCPTNSSFVPRQFSGFSAPGYVSIPWCSQGLVHFSTDNSIVYSGFSLEYLETVEGCGNTSYYGPSGAISSPNHPRDYTNNLNCDYNVYASMSTMSSILLIFESFYMPYGNDFVTVSCPTNSSFLPQEFSGDTVPDPVSIPWCSHGIVNFHTDTDSVYSGFRLDYFVSEAVCGNTLYTDNEGYVISPNWPSDYGSNLNCLNIIWAPFPFTFYLFNESFILQNNCSCDWLEISCLDNSEFGPIRYCGSHPFTKRYIHNCTKVLLWFHSDDYDNYQGFSIRYNVLPLAHQYCGNTSFHGPSGVISSPNHPGVYYNQLYCNYDIYASTGSSLSFIFKSLKTEVFYDFVTISCPTNASLPAQEYSGYSLPDPVSLPWCSQGRVNFCTDYSDIGTGFTLDYFVSDGGCGNTVYSDTLGNVTSPNWPSDYGYTQNCSNIIWAPQQSTFDLYFESFNLDSSCCTCDWLEISCLDNSEFGLYRYCGTDAPASLSVNGCRQVLLWFHSDDSSNSQGFNIEYNVYPDERNIEMLTETITG